MKRKALAVFMTTAVVISSMAGCGVSTGSSNSKEEETTGSAADDTSNTADSENQESEDTTTDDGEDVTKASDDSMKDREEINLWFWGAEPYAQDAMKKYLVDEYNASQDKYQLVVEFRPSVDSDMTTALAANQGPDIVYGSGPAFVMPLVEAGKLEEMDTYAEEYGWKDRILEPYYESGTVDGKLYSLTNGISTMGVFYNKKVLEDNGWEVPETIEYNGIVI